MRSIRAGMILVSAAGAIFALGFAADGGTDVAAGDDARTEIEAAFGLYDSVLFDMDFDHGPGEAFEVTVPLAGQTYTLALHPHSVRADGFRVMVQLDDGSLQDIEPAPERTLRGTVVGVPGSIVAASTNDQGLTARIYLGDDEEYWVEPVAANIPDAPRGAYLSYAGTDVIPSGGECGVEDTVRPVGDNGGGGGSRGGPACGGPLCEAELGIDADFQYFQAHGGSTTNVQNTVEAVINTVNIEYERDVLITHAITAIIIRTSSATNPYTTNGASALLGQVRTEWQTNQSGVPHDIAELFTGRNLTGSTIGIAYIGAVCTVNKYSVVQSDCCGAGACRSDLSAHELGHNWNGLHCNCSAYTMHTPLACANQFHPQFTIPDIVAFRDSRTCLAIGGDLEAPLPNPMEFITAPFATGSDSVGMVSSQGVDDHTIEYYFDNTAGGPGADDRVWGTSAIYVDDGLTPNTLYSYRVRARDTASPSNEGTFSPAFDATTLAELPPAPAVSGITTTSMDVNPDPAGNPPGTEMAIQCSSTADAVWDGQYVGPSGNPSATLVWQTDAAWGTTTLNGLLAGGIEYCFQVKAKNSVGAETGFSPATCASTQADPQTILSVRSCKDHAGQRWCLDLDGGGIEPRWNPTQLEFDLTGNVAGVAATLTCTNGTGGTATVAISVGLNGSQSLLTIDFAALPNVDCCTVTLTGDVEQAFDFHVLAGDVNGSGTVNATDKNLVKGNINKPVDATRFQMDVNSTGAINATDKNLTKGWIGETAATCP